MTKQAQAAPETAEIFDIGAFETAEIGHMTVRHPITGAPTTWVWMMTGPGHPVTIAQSDRIARKSLKEAAAMKQSQVNSKKWHEDAKEPADVRRENAEFFAERVLGWSPVRINGADYPFSRENVIAILLDPKMPALWDQVVDYFRADENFMKTSAPIS